MMLNKKLVLASKSPRRSELLQKARFDFRVIMKDVKEHYPQHLSLQEIPTYLAALKAHSILDAIVEDEIIIAADTIVVKGSKVYGKPEGREDAIATLKELSGAGHDVITGVCLLSRSKEKSFSVTTHVTFNEITDDEILHYVDHYHPFDKAGAYAIQEWIGLIGIEKIEGCYFNVVGLPVSRLYKELQEM